jgi:hypothetical protein
MVAFAFPAESVVQHLTADGLAAVVEHTRIW